MLDILSPAAWSRGKTGMARVSAMPNTDWRREMLNHITIMGRLTRDPELRHTQTGTAVASFTLAVDRDFKDKSTGDRATDFIDVVSWRQTGEFVSRYFTKGRMAVVEGRLQIRDWTDKDGNKRRSAEVIANNVYFGDSKRDSGSDYQYGNDEQEQFSELTDEDGELPF
nr:MAG TPA: Single strand binding protein [Caudoviricetes sp.]